MTLTEHSCMQGTCAWSDSHHGTRDFECVQKLRRKPPPEAFLAQLWQCQCRRVRVNGREWDVGYDESQQHFDCSREGPGPIELRRLSYHVRAVLRSVSLCRTWLQMNQLCCSPPSSHKRHWSAFEILAKCEDCVTLSHTCAIAV